MKTVFKMFGQIPEVLEDVWIAVAQNKEAEALEIINKMPTSNPFIIKYETEIPDCGEWEKCAEVLEQDEKLAELMQGW